MADTAQDTQTPTPSLADAVEEMEEQQSDFQAAYNSGGHFKEQLEAIAGLKKEVIHAPERKVTEVAEVPTSPEVAPELEGYIEKVEKDPELQKALADDYVKQVGMVAPAPTQVQVKLPLTNQQMQQGLHHKIFESIRWLAIWCLRQMKMISLKRA